jgi:hypothetical protein
MQKFLLAALVAAALFAPSALAQNQTVTVEIQDLPASGLSNETALIVPFKVHATVGGGPCVTGNTASSYTISLAATVTDSTGNSTTANVNPRQVTIAGPVLLPAAPGASAERTEDAVLVVNAGPYSGDSLNATVHITATFAGSSGGCTGTTAPAASDQADFQANFEPAVGFGEPADNGQKLPGVGLGLTLIALAGLVLLVRRD